MMNVSVIFWEKWIYQKLYEISYILLPGAHWWIGEYFVPWPSVKIRPLNFSRTSTLVFIKLKQSSF